MVEEVAEEKRDVDGGVVVEEDEDINWGLFFGLSALSCVVCTVSVIVCDRYYQRRSTRVRQVAGDEPDVARVEMQARGSMR